MGAKTRDVNETEFQQEVLDSSMPVLVDFTAELFVSGHGSSNNLPTPDITRLLPGAERLPDSPTAQVDRTQPQCPPPANTELSSQTRLREESRQTRLAQAAPLQRAAVQT